MAAWLLRPKFVNYTKFSVDISVIDRVCHSHLSHNPNIIQALRKHALAKLNIHSPIKFNEYHHTQNDIYFYTFLYFMVKLLLAFKE